MRETREAGESEPDWYAASHWRAQPLWYSFADASEQAGNATVADDAESITLPMLLDRALRIAGGLSSKGIACGDAVIVQSRNCLEAYATLLACFSQGFVAIPLPPMFSVGQVAAVAASAEARAFVALEDESAARAAEVLAASPTLRVAFAADAPDEAGGGLVMPWRACLEADPLVPAPPDPAADAMILFSSGSTGAPKGVVHSGNSLRFPIEALARLHQVGQQDHVLVALEFGFVGGTVLGALLAFLCGASTTLMRRWEATACLDTVERHGITYTLLMPTHCYDIVNHPELDSRNTASLSRAIMAGATPEQRRTATGRFCGTPLPMYGMSESIGHCTCAVEDAEENRNTTDGRPLPGTEMLVLDEDGRPVKIGEIGNVFLRGPNRLRRYQSRPDLTGHAIVEGGWFRTGDRARFSAGGFMTFVARASELIRRGGVMIQPAEVEAVLRNHSAIAEVAVVGVEDERLGERACACVVLMKDGTFDIETMRAYVAESGLPRYQWPEYLLIFQEFPRTPSLKVRRADLAKIARERVR